MKHQGTKELSSERLLLRRLKEEDAEEIYNGFINQKEYLYYTNRNSRTLEEEINSLKRIDNKYESLDYYNWMITLKSTNKIIGTISLKVEEINELVEVNYAIDNRYTNNGYMTEALTLVRDYCLNKLKVNRFQGCCATENVASRRVMEKCNMQLEGTLRNYLILEDGYHDMHMLSIINKK